MPLSDVSDGLPSIVCDNGSWSIKSCFSDGDGGALCSGSDGCQPPLVGGIRSFIPVVGRPKKGGATKGVDREVIHSSSTVRDYYVGHEALARRGVLSLQYPITDGFVGGNWEDMEKVWQNMFFNEMRVSPNEQNILLTEHPVNPKINRAKMAEIMFETFDVPAMYVSVPAVLSLLASGRATGIVLDVGHGTPHAVPIYEGYSLPHAVSRGRMGGQDVTYCLGRALQEVGVKFVTPAAERDASMFMKERLCSVPLDFEAEVTTILSENTSADSSDEPSLTLPDGSTLRIHSKHRHACLRSTEALFEPRNAGLGLEFRGLQHVLRQSISHCDADLCPTLYSNIVLAGGSTMFKGFAERLSKEIASDSFRAMQEEAFAPPSPVNVIAPANRQFTACIGGTIMSSMMMRQPTRWVTKEEYAENGPDVVHQKCF